MSPILQDGPYWLSPTKISMALACPLKAQRRYKQKLPEQPSLPMHRGNMLHGALEETKGTPDGLVEQTRKAWEFATVPRWSELFAPWLALQDEMAPVVAELDAYAAQIKADAEAGRRKGGAQAPRMTKDFREREAELLAPWRDTIDSLRAAERELLDDPERSPWAPTTRGGFDEYQSSLDTARDYQRWWNATAVDDRPEVLHCERRFETILNDNEFKLGGRIDRIDLDPTRDALVVVDYKTGTSSFGKHDRWVQAACYALGAEQAIGQRPDLVRFIDLDRGPATETYRVYPTWDIELVETCRRARDLIEGPPTRTFQSCGICAYTDLCFAIEGNGVQFQPLEDLTGQTTTEAAA